MPYVDVDYMCRICLSLERTPLVNVTEAGTNGESLVEAVHSFYNVTILENEENIPKGICQSCINCINVWKLRREKAKVDQQIISFLAGL